MTTRFETYEQYLTVCNLHKKEKNKLIEIIFETPVEHHLEQHDDNKNHKNEDIIDPNGVLNLRGNNYFYKGMKILNDDAFTLYHTLKINSCISTLDLRFNRISDDGAAWISKLLQENNNLKHLNLMCNDIGPDGTEKIGSALQKNKSLVYLNLNGNKIGNKGGMSMAQMLQVNSTLQTLDIGDTDLKIESLIALSTILNYNKSLKSLNVNRPVPQYQFANWMDEIAQHFAIMLKKNTGLQELYMQKYEMRDYGAQWLSENLSYNHSLVYLDLSCNRITRDGAKYISEFLKRDTPLRVLDLSYNRLEDDGAKIIAEALHFANHTLEKLSIRYNNIRAEGLCAIADSLEYNKTLSHIFIWGNHLEEPACIAFKKLFDRSRLKNSETDVRPYQVDKKTYLCEVTNGINLHYYWQPVYGNDAYKSHKNI